MKTTFKSYNLILKTRNQNNKGITSITFVRSCLASFSFILNYMFGLCIYLFGNNTTVQGQCQHQFVCLEVRTFVLARSTKRTLQDLQSNCKIHHMQDGSRGLCTYLEDLGLVRSSKSIFQVLARFSKTIVWQDKAR